PLFRAAHRRHAAGRQRPGARRRTPRRDALHRRLMAALPSREAITGLVLAGVDKGLQPWHGRPLVDHAIERLAPQVATVMISANRNAADYASRAGRVL